MAIIATDYLDDTVKRKPDAVAITDSSRQVTYRELWQEARSFAAALIDITEKHDAYPSYTSGNLPIAILLNKSVSCVAAILGSAYSGNTAVPLDADTPYKRLQKIILELEPAVIVTDREHFDTAKKLIDPSKVILYDEMHGDFLSEDVTRRRNRVTDTDPLYIFFTSGSTGIPKGVVVSHRSILYDIEWITEAFDFSDCHAWGNEAPLSFAMSSLDIFSSLKLGIPLCLLDKSMFIFPAQTLEIMTQKQLNVLICVPSVLTAIANAGLFDENVALPPLKKVIFSGGVMPNKQLNMWRKTFPQTKFVNIYALTELSSVCAYYTADRDFADDEPLPIGQPCRNSDILVLNENDERAAVGEVGELCVRGSCLGLGYLNNPVLNAKVFVPNPLNKRYPERIFRTGDFVRQNERGELVYVSRCDDEIKHHGQRIALGEIDTAAQKVKDLHSCCAVYNKEREELVLFYTGDTTKEAIAAELKTSLPRYMLPTRFIKTSEMPLTGNGKISRLLLQKLL